MVPIVELVSGPLDSGVAAVGNINQQMEPNQATMINARHEPLNRYALLTGFIVLLFVPLMVALFPERWFPPHGRGATVNVPRYMNNATPIPFSPFEEETRIRIDLPNDGETYLGRNRVTGEDLVEGIKNLKAARPADAQIIYLKAGVGVSHGSIVETLKTIRAAGIDRVGLVVKRKAPGGGIENGALEVKLQVPAGENQTGK